MHQCIEVSRAYVGKGEFALKCFQAQMEQEQMVKKKLMVLCTDDIWAQSQFS